MTLAFEDEDIQFRYAMGKMKQSGAVLYDILSGNTVTDNTKIKHIL